MEFKAFEKYLLLLTYIYKYINSRPITARVYTLEYKNYIYIYIIHVLNDRVDFRKSYKKEEKGKGKMHPLYRH